MEKVIFTNKEGRELKTTLSDAIMNKVADLVETELTNKGIFYFRDGTNFTVSPNYINSLLKAQMKATKKLIADGTITMDMIIHDVKSNYY